MCATTIAMYFSLHPFSVHSYLTWQDQLAGGDELLDVKVVHALSPLSWKHAQLWSVHLFIYSCWEFHQCRPVLTQCCLWLGAELLGLKSQEVHLKDIANLTYRLVKALTFWFVSQWLQSQVKKRMLLYNGLFIYQPLFPDTSATPGLWLFNIL